MRKLFLSISIIFGLTGLVTFLGLARSVRADLPADEGELNPGGAAYEINPDDKGILWISDFEAGEIWGVVSSNWTYTKYPVGGDPSDARRVGEHLWWADISTNTLGRISTKDHSMDIWRVTDSIGLFGTGIDSQGRVWATDAGKDSLYRLDPAVNELCTYTIPDNGRSDYLLVDGGTIWLEDWENQRLVKLSLATNKFKWWSLPVDSSPVGITQDGQGNIWYADSFNLELARLDPGADQVARYSQPSTQPRMITMAGDNMWYTSGLNQGIGVVPSVSVLNPQVASHTIFTPTLGSSQVISTCITQEPDSMGILNPAYGVMALDPTSFGKQAEDNGWQSYQLPPGSSPWGIAAVQGKVWFVDTDRTVLARMPATAQVTACVRSDADGDPLTLADQAPLAGWTLYLTQDGTRQAPGSDTETDGCTTWSDLMPATAYGVEGDLPPGWQALVQTSHSFGQVEAGNQYSYTFIHTQGLSLYLPIIRR